MRGGGCFIIARPMNIKLDFYYAGDKEDPKPMYIPAPEDIHYELDPELDGRAERDFGIFNWQTRENSLKSEISDYSALFGQGLFLL